MVAVRRVLDASDPVAAFFAAARAGQPVGLPTSGTSAAPRTVIRSPASWLESVAAVADRTGADGHSRFWIPGPLTATMNLFAAVTARVLGARVVGSLTEATHAQLTPAQLARTRPAGLAGRTLVVAGDRLEPRRREWAEGHGARVLHYYGAAELSFVAWGSDAESLRPFPDVEIQLRDGTCWVRSPYLAEAVSGPPGTWQRDPDGFATVGDRCRWRGDYLSVLGRDEAVTTGGVTVLTADVEQSLRAGLAGEIAVLGLEHATVGQILVAVLSDPGDRALARASARALRPAERPRRWFVLPSWPTTEAGKLDRGALLAALAERAAVRP